MERLPTGFYRCLEDKGIAQPLLGEEDKMIRAATEEIHCKLITSDGKEHDRDGLRVRLTTHRLLWHSSGGSGGEWIALRLDEFDSAVLELPSLFFRSAHVKVSGRGVTVDIKYKDHETAKQITEQLQASLKAAAWQRGSYDPVRAGGLAKLKRDDVAHSQAVGEALTVATTDLNALREHAQRTVASVRDIARTYATSQEGKAEGGGIGGLLEEFGLVDKDGSAISLSGDIEADVAKVCEKALEKRGVLGMLLAHDVFCLVNRARGTALVSPEEVMAALRSASAPGGKLRMRTLGSVSTYAFSLAASSDAEADKQLLASVERGPLSAFRIAAELNLNAAEAQYLLRDAEVRGVLVRDEAPDDVFYYRNFFNDFPR